MTVLKWDNPSEHIIRVRLQSQPFDKCSCNSLAVALKTSELSRRPKLWNLDSAEIGTFSNGHLLRLPSLLRRMPFHFCGHGLARRCEQTRAPRLHQRATRTLRAGRLGLVARATGVKLLQESADCRHAGEQHNAENNDLLPIHSIPIRSVFRLEKPRTSPDTPARSCRRS